ncbi:Predicted dithiol-disulfide isomerase, DsbA family [Collimonas sp. OK307]|uniref:DsbA family oxidoreductase n=1 Tax=Collimonas sp. OK307 TaxID=1801620 RepID=UPI0008E5C7D7|nr:DsbA family oxidoreductase [Collimonas sp. OK307]SFH61939.1 Predicted dithiol-disulfide isomerase, DsbA family [Collimonas sp. OK307]
MKSVIIEITSDFICPWCWIGHHHLRQAIRGLDTKIAPQIRYVPYELNPSMPAEGMNRRTYRSAKFGSWVRSMQMDAEVAIAGQRAGVIFNYDRVEMIPNTRLAHRLMYFAQLQGESEKAGVLFESIFATYFSEGSDIGNLDVLIELAETAGFDGKMTRSFLASEQGNNEVAQAELTAQERGVRSVPNISIGDYRVAGAQPVDVLADLLDETAAGSVA